MTRARDPRQRSLALIIHGSRADDPGLRDAVQQARALGVRVRPRVTFEVGDAASFAREAVEAGCSAVVAVGGDGTVNEVLNGLAGHDVPLGIVPLGTANDFARQVGIPEDAEHALDLILRGDPVRLDTAELNGRRFLNVSAGGIGAEATAETGAAAKAALGPLAYALTGLKKLVALETRSLRFQMPDGERTHDALLFAVGNARASGGGMPVTPLASPNDGLLDVCVVERMGRADVARLALKVRRGEHLGEEGVFYYRVPSVVILAEEPLEVNVDGEPVRAAELRYRARPGDLRIFLPALRPDDERPAGDERQRAVPTEEP
jgi:lipid kinase YegS